MFIIAPSVYRTLWKRNPVSSNVFCGENNLKRWLISAYLKVGLFYPMYWCWDRFLLPQFVTAQNAQVWLNGCCIFSHIPVTNVDVYVFPLHNWRMNIPSVTSWAGLSLLLLKVTSMCVMSFVESFSYNSGNLLFCTLKLQNWNDHRGSDSTGKSSHFVTG